MSAMFTESVRPFAVMSLIGLCGVDGESLHGNHINAQHVQFLGQCGDSGGQETAPEQGEYQEAGANHDDLPF